MNQNSNTNLIEIIDNELRISHRIIAKQTENKEETISRLIRNYHEKLELFGQVGFKIQTVKNSAGAINEQKTFYLNEQQATLLLTFMRNNEIVIIFKVNLVSEFFNMREILAKQNFDLQKIRERAELLEILEKEFGILREFFTNLESREKKN
ncbi:Phage regulatory protein Rha (Phage_pRha) [Thiovulum sp. ES]|nr:Phage regulatory protein Rha (Phage_pRha) [Thiovulum sp. ES]